jgi:hypothetical protein
LEETYSLSERRERYIKIIIMARAPKTWEDNIVEKLKNFFGWPEAQAKNEVGKLITLPNRSAFSSLFLAAALDYRKKLNNRFSDQLEKLMAVASNKKKYPSHLIPIMQEEGEFPTRKQLENILNRVVEKIRKSEIDKQIYLREKDEIVSYFLTIIDFEAIGTEIKEENKERIESEEEESED